jgi:hypothetical protein
MYRLVISIPAAMRPAVKKRLATCKSPMHGTLAEHLMKANANRYWAFLRRRTGPWAGLTAQPPDWE